MFLSKLVIKIYPFLLEVALWLVILGLSLVGLAQGGALGIIVGLLAGVIISGVFLGIFLILNDMREKIAKIEKNTYQSKID